MKKADIPDKEIDVNKTRSIFFPSILLRILIAGFSIWGTEKYKNDKRTIIPMLIIFSTVNRYLINFFIKILYQIFSTKLERRVYGTVKSIHQAKA